MSVKLPTVHAYLETPCAVVVQQAATKSMSVFNKAIGLDAEMLVRLPQVYISVLQGVAGAHTVWLLCSAARARRYACTDACMQMMQPCMHAC